MVCTSAVMVCFESCSPGKKGLERTEHSGLHHLLLLQQEANTKYHVHLLAQ